MDDGLQPVCYVCNASDSSVLPVTVEMVAQRQGLKSEDSRRVTTDVAVCGRCWGGAALQRIAGSARP